MKLDNRRSDTLVDQNEECFVTLRAEMAYQVVVGFPSEFAAKREWFDRFLKYPTTYTSRLHFGRTCPCRKNSPRFFTLPGTNFDTHTFNDHCEIPQQSQPSPRNGVHLKTKLSLSEG
jgi:hypothetical protein